MTLLDSWKSFIKLPEELNMITRQMTVFGMATFHPSPDKDFLKVIFDKPTALHGGVKTLEWLINKDGIAKILKEEPTTTKESE